METIAMEPFLYTTRASAQRDAESAREIWTVLGRLTPDQRTYHLLGPNRQRTMQQITALMAPSLPVTTSCSAALKRGSKTTRTARLSTDRKSHW
jgi:hypothetical protein